MRRIKEWTTLQIAKKPGRVVILAIFAFNILFFLFAALVIRGLSLTGTEQMGFFSAVFYTLTMILDAGCIQFVIEDIGQANVILAIICLAIVIIGMISFTGAVIGYITNYISTFIANSNSGGRKLNLRRVMGLAACAIVTVVGYWITAVLLYGGWAAQFVGTVPGNLVQAAGSGIVYSVVALAMERAHHDLHAL